MATTEELKLRVVHKHDTEENWLKATNFIPKQGEIIIYDIDDNYNYERFKIGDGITNVNALSFGASNKFYGPVPVLPLPPNSLEEEYRIPIKIRIQDNEMNREGTGNIPYYRYVDRELVFEAWSNPTDFVYTETFTIYDYPGGMEQTLDYSITISYSWDGWVITNNTDGVITFLIEDDITLAGSGKVLTEISKDFSVINDWSTNNVPAIKIGNTILTETKLNQLIAFVDGIESGDPAVVEPIAQNYLDTTVAEEGTW